MSHIGHYIWNIVSGWSPLFSLVSSERIDVLTSYCGWQIFGGVTELYPEHAAHVKSVLCVDSHDAIYEIMLEQRGLSLLLLDGYITTLAAARIVDWSRSHCRSKFDAEIQAFRTVVFPLVMITIRTENRAWVEQQEGFALMINELALEFPQLGIVLDGINTGMAQVGSHGWMSLDDEQAIADSIIAACPNVRIYNAIGCLPHESIVLADAIDAFVAPIGAGLAKTRWVANKPGVGFSNESFMAPGNFQGFLYDRFREDAVPMRYVDLSDVKDVGDAQHGEVWRSNFSMSWQAPLRELKTLLKAL